MTASAHADAAHVDGTTTICCDSHEIGNVLDAKGIEWMLEDTREAALNIYLTVPSTVPAKTPELETAGGDLTPDEIAALFDAWPEALALGERMDFVPVVMGEERTHAIIAAALERGRPVSGEASAPISCCSTTILCRNRPGMAANSSSRAASPRHGSTRPCRDPVAIRRPPMRRCICPSRCRLWYRPAAGKLHRQRDPDYSARHRTDP